jgi:multidrug resistance efflux pump
VRQIDASLTNAVIRAPFDGVVTVRDREPGETVGPAGRQLGDGHRLREAGLHPGA